MNQNDRSSKIVSQLILGGSLALGLVVILAIYKGIAFSRAMAQHANFKPPPEAITSLTVNPAPWALTASAVGSVSAVQGAVMSFEEPGNFRAFRVEPGVTVEAGTLLAELDATVQEAQLKGALARLDLARQELERVRNMRGRNAMSQSDLDKAESEFRSADATAGSLKAEISRRRIIAPYRGRTGIRQVDVGAYVAAGTPVLPFFALDPVHINFSLPQQYLSRLATGQEVSIRLEDGSERVMKAQLTAINPNVDERTRNVALQATASNPDDALRPGMFVRVEVTLGSSPEVIAVPASSINYAPYGDSVYVISSLKDPQGQEYLGVSPQIVKLGERRGDQISILSGLKAGDRIATSGVFKLRPGAAVQINDALAPENNPAPKPADR